MRILSQQKIEGFLLVRDEDLSDEVKSYLQTLANDKGVTIPSAVELWLTVETVEEDEPDWRKIQRLSYSDPIEASFDDTADDTE